MITTSLTKSKDNIAMSMRNLNTRMKQEGAAIALKVAKYFQKQARVHCPVRSGRLHESIGNPSRDGIWETSAGGLRITVGTKVNYALAVEMGIRESYIIRAKNGKMLKFRWLKMGGGLYFFKQVKHPKIKGKFFMKKAGIDVQANMRNLLGGN